MISEEKEIKSELQILLEKNAYGEGLTEEEYQRALELIRKPIFGNNDCWICGMYGDHKKEIYDTGLCQYHARYALLTRK